MAAPGANSNVACSAQQYIRSGGNPDIGPEKSKTFSAGIVIEPTKSLTVSLDYFQIKLRDKIGTVAEQTLFDNYDKYQNNFIYSNGGTKLEYVLATLDNLGEMHTSGIDLGLNWKLPRSQYGNFTFNFDGTWVQKYEYQNERGGYSAGGAGLPQPRGGRCGHGVELGERDEQRPAAQALEAGLMAKLASSPRGFCANSS